MSRTELVPMSMKPTTWPSLVPPGLGLSPTETIVVYTLSPVSPAANAAGPRAALARADLRWPPVEAMNVFRRAPVAYTTGSKRRRRACPATAQTSRRRTARVTRKDRRPGRRRTKAAQEARRRHVLQGARQAADRARQAAGVDPRQGPQGRHHLRGPRRGRQGRHHQARHRDAQPALVRVVALGVPTEREKTQWYFQRYVAHAAGRPASGSSSTAPGTTAPVSSA